MTVKELIEKLKGCDPDRKVYLRTLSKEDGVKDCKSIVQGTVIENNTWSTEWPEENALILRDW